MSESVNKFGLKRYIPERVRMEIRREAGFGCVICGCVLVDYEHIDPEFNQAREHDPQKMTLLCISCHGRVTRKIISKAAVWEAKNNPKALQSGFVHDLLFIDSSKMEIKLGNSYSKNTKVVLSIYGKPILWFEAPELEGEPSKLCAIFYDAKGRAVSYINRNQFIAFSSNQDIRSESTKLSVVSNDVMCLRLDREGGEVLHVSRMEGAYLDQSVSVNADGSLILKRGESVFTFDELYVDGCGSLIRFGEPLSVVRHNKLYLAFRLARSDQAVAIQNFNGDFVGWEFCNEIFNKKYELVGCVRNKQVFNLVDEFVGSLVGSYIAHRDSCYESGEPIYISKENSDFRSKHPDIGYDLSFRLFGGDV